MRITTILGLAALVASVGAVFACVVDNPTPVPEVSCANYCTKIMARCITGDTDDAGVTMDNLVYKNEATCLDMCQFIDPGAVGDTTNTLGCRLGQLALLDDPQTLSARHSLCLEAAAFSTACGPSKLCDQFCELGPKVCGPLGLDPYPDNATCMATCQGFKESDAFLPGSFVGSTGDNLRCRSYHMENAVIDDQSHKTHCPHIGKVSATCFDMAPDGGGDSGTPDAGGD